LKGIDKAITESLKKQQQQQLSWEISNRNKQNISVLVAMEKSTGQSAD